MRSAGTQQAMVPSTAAGPLGSLRPDGRYSLAELEVPFVRTSAAREYLQWRALHEVMPSRRSTGLTIAAVLSLAAVALNALERLGWFPTSSVGPLTLCLSGAFALGTWGKTWLAFRRRTKDQERFQRAHEAKLLGQPEGHLSPRRSCACTSIAQCSTSAIAGRR